MKDLDTTTWRAGMQSRFRLLRYADKRMVNIFPRICNLSFGRMEEWGGCAASLPAVTLELTLRRYEREEGTTGPHAEARSARGNSIGGPDSRPPITSAYRCDLCGEES